MIYKNKYNIEMSKELLLSYYDSLIGSFYKILPISEQETNEQYKKYISNFIMEICGGYYLFDENAYFLKLLNNLEYLLQIDNIEHKKIKSSVFKISNGI
jgi:hypothetical protein